MSKANTDKTSRNISSGGTGARVFKGALSIFCLCCCADSYTDHMILTLILTPSGVDEKATFLVIDDIVEISTTWRTR